MMGENIFNKVKMNIFYILNNLTKYVIPIKVKSIDVSIDTLLRGRMSLARFGDGELAIMNGRNIGFQDSTLELKEKLKYIIRAEDNNFMVAIPGPLKEIDSNFTEYAKTCWENHLQDGRISWIKYIKLRKEYYNALLTRFYMDYNNKENTVKWIGNIKKLWSNREIVIIEGDESKLGIGNDLFADTKSIKRILAPSKNAFSKYDEILNVVKKNISKDKLILIALGPTATVLAYDLFKLGYQAIDIGHIDIEYEWYLRGATEKIKIPNKFVNEVSGGEEEINSKLDVCSHEVLTIIR